MKIVRVTKQEIQACRFKPEPHTVAFADDGDWLAVKNGARIIACLCVCKKKTGLFLTSLYTVPEFRGMGVMGSLVKYVVDNLYPGQRIEAHCLEASRNLVERAGFHEDKVTYFKHGTQWRMIRDGNK